MLLENGEYHQLQELDKRMAARMREAREGVGAADGDNNNEKTQKALTMHSASVAIDELLKEIQSACLRGRRNRRKNTPSAADSVFEDELRRRLVKELITACKAQKSCQNCGAYSPKIRQDSSNKIFQSPLSLTAKRANASDGIRLVSAMVKSSENTNRDDEMGGYDSDEFHSAKEDSDDDDNDDENDADVAKDKYMHVSEVQAQVRRTWATNPELCNSVFSVHGPEIYFVQAVPVPPNRFRPPMHLGGMVVEHVQNGYLNSILQANETLRNNFVSKNESGAYTTWIELQTHFNCLLDSSKDPSSNPNPSPGIRQLLERKEGIFRKHMMGKRVNHACRSVISPDPYIGTNEIGLPRYFAETLTYPTPVTDINVGEMRNLVERGPSQYPGARWVEFPDRRVDLSKMDDHKREAIAARLLTYSKKGSKPAIVGRQLRDGDMVLMNRQPTLHKPGIMGHQVRVLHDPTQKTIRMHYASKFLI
jgi:DNA-directed RNA polymerase I subunit RPA1